MDTLDLDVEQPTGIECDAGPRFDVGGQPLLVGVLDRAPRGPKRNVIDMGLESTQLSELGKQLLPGGAIEQISQPRVSERHKAARCYTVGLVAEAFRPEVVEILQYARFE